MLSFLFVLCASFVRGEEDVPATVTFLNEMDEPVEVFWDGPEGPAYVDRMGPHEEVSHETWIGHSFEVRKIPASAEVQGEFLGAWDIQWETERISISDETQADSAVATIVNGLDETVSVYYSERLANGSLADQLIGTLQSSEEMSQQTWLGHQFLVKDSSNKTIRIFTVDEPRVTVDIWAD